MLIITDDQFRFGKRGIGVGSTKDEMHAAFARSRPVDADELQYSAEDFPDVDEGYYGDFWCRLLFSYDDDGRVDAMAYEPSAHW